MKEKILPQWSSDTPCKDCTDRVLGCHGHCEKYAAFRAETERVKALVKEQKDKYRDFRKRR